MRGRSRFLTTLWLLFALFSVCFVMELSKGAIGSFAVGIVFLLFILWGLLAFSRFWRYIWSSEVSDDLLGVAEEGSPQRPDTLEELRESLRQASLGFPEPAARSEDSPRGAKDSGPKVRYRIGADREDDQLIRDIADMFRSL